MVAVVGGMHSQLASEEDKKDTRRWAQRLELLVPTLNNLALCRLKLMMFSEARGVASMVSGPSYRLSRSRVSRFPGALSAIAHSA
jgi:hypothetical protein